MRRNWTDRIADEESLPISISLWTPVEGATVTLWERAVDVAWGLLLLAGCGAFAVVMGVI